MTRIVVTSYLGYDHYQQTSEPLVVTSLSYLQQIDQHPTMVVCHDANALVNSFASLIDER